jgi:hypothetical protein
VCSDGARKDSGERPDGRVGGVHCRCRCRYELGESFWKVAAGKERPGEPAVVVVAAIVFGGVGWSAVVLEVVVEGRRDVTLVNAQKRVLPCLLGALPHRMSLGRGPGRSVSGSGRAREIPDRNSGCCITNCGQNCGYVMVQMQLGNHENE